MSYILDLRAKVGSQPLISVGAAVIIFNETGQFLLVHRTDTRTWGLPAGSKELNEPWKLQPNERLVKKRACTSRI
ncbi:hypothetical protein [Secundilactobacillus kimchicus]|uniref:hypothetical protein n=1 Tax=Secundilactobacillus kimchicus TaxID=528209 RepID=UPI000AB64B3D|nr:hypothetical protein [Secundilactobacillus kimchicus]